MFLANKTKFMPLYTELFIILFRYPNFSILNMQIEKEVITAGVNILRILKKYV